MSTPILLLKAASAAGIGANLGKALKATAKGTKKVIQGSGDMGAAAAKELGGNELVGRAAGYAGLAGGAYLGGKRVKHEKDKFLWRHGLLR